MSRYSNQTIATVVVCLLIGCSLVGDDQMSVTGVWGASQVELTAGPSGIGIDLWCSQVTFPGPVPLIHGDSFAVNGKVTADSWTPLVGQSWRLSGVIVGDTLVMTTSYLHVGTADTWEGPWTQKLARGHGTFSHLPCQV